MISALVIVLLVAGGAVHLRTQVEMFRAVRRDPGVSMPLAELPRREIARRLAFVFGAGLSIPVVLFCVYEIGARRSVRTGAVLAVTVFVAMMIAFVPLLFLAARRELAHEEAVHPIPAPHLSAVGEPTGKGPRSAAGSVPPKTPCS